MNLHLSNAFLRALVICSLVIGMAVSNVSLVVYSPSVANAALTQSGDRSTSATTSLGFNKAVYKKDAVAPTGGGVWTTGDAGKNYRENQWVFYQYQITGVGATPLPNFVIEFNHMQANTSAVFVDAFANFRACMDGNCTQTNQSGPMQYLLMDGVPYPQATDTTNWKPVPTTGPDVVITNINYPFDAATNTCKTSPDPLDTPSESHCFSVNGSALASLVGATAGSHTITLFYEAHLASSAVWSLGREANIALYDGVGAEAVPAGTLFGTDVYTGWTTTAYLGAGAATGSSRHFTLEGPGGAIALPIPAVPAPSGSIEIVKETVPANATGKTFSFTSTLGGFGLDTDTATTTVLPDKTFASLGGGFPFTFTESAPPTGWTLTDISCTKTKDGTLIDKNVATRTVVVTLDVDGDSVVCTFHNEQGTYLTLSKHVINDAGGTANASAWTLAATGTSGSFSGTGTPATGADASLTHQVTAGVQYTLSETGTPTGYTAGTTWSCTGDTAGYVSPNKITLQAGQSATCTITNNDTDPSLHLRKTVTNDNGGTALNTAWTLTATGTGASPTNLSGTTPVDSGTGFKADTYALAETGGPSGYTAGAWDCGTATMTDTTHVVVPLGDSVTCTINNNDSSTALHLRKTVTNDNGGTALNTAWTLTATGTVASPTNLSGTTPVDSGATFKADTYALAETGGPTGYTAGTWSCGTATMSDPTHVVVPLGADVTCTITNNDNAPALHLRKTVTNDNGGTAANTAWTLTATGTLATPTNLSGTTPVDSTATFKADTYALAETGGPSGYTAGTWSCPSATMPDATHVVVPLGANITCTISNNDTAPALHLRKTVTNDNGGTALATAWTLTATGTLASPTNLSGATPVDSGTGFKADTYALAETGGASGYTAGAWSCGSATMTDATHVVVGLGDDITCTINNNDNAPALHLRKTVTNDDGGTALDTAWTLTATGTLASPTNLSGTTPVDSGATFKADTYALAETGGPSGYTASAWSCGTATMSDPTHVVVPLGADITCTINNNDQAAHLILIKHVVNDNNGSVNTASAWTLTVNGVTVVGGNSVAGAESPGTTVTLSTVGGYYVTEAGPANYTADYSTDCSGTIALGQTKTCTITNDDNAPGLHLRKVVVNDNGGTAVATDWTLTATGTTTLSGQTPVDSGSTFVGGTYTLSETGGPSGYTASDWVCVGGTQDGTSVTVHLGDSVTCTITNNDIAPQLHLRKQVTNDNGGTAAATDWTLSATGQGETPTVLSGTTPVDSGATFTAGTYTLAESGGPTTYTAGSWSCGEAMTDATHVAVGIGDNVTCTITNNDNAAHLIVIKHVVGSQKPASDFTIAISGVTTAGVSTFAGAEAPGVDRTLTSVGDYQVTETPVASYNIDYSADCNGTIGIGETKTCTITNTYAPYVPPTGNLTVTKYNDLNGNGTRDAGEPALSGWTFSLSMNGMGIGTLTTDATGSATRTGLAPATYMLVETLQTGWTSTDPGTSTPTKSVVVTANATSTVLFGNKAVTLPPTTQGGTVTVTKYEDANANKQRETSEAALSGWTFTITNDQGTVVATITTGALGIALAQNLAPGVYTVTETTQTGWVSTDPGGSAPSKQVLVEAGQTISVIFGNAKVQLPSTSTGSEAPEAIAMLALALGLGFIAIRRRIREI